MKQDIEIRKFDDGVGYVGLGLSGLKVEAFRTDGTSNYLANLNYNGQTWAAALRFPARGANLNEFLSEKESALRSVEYLISVLKSGVDVGFDCTLNFGGVSCLVDNSSAKQFLYDQAKDSPLFLIDRINKREKKIVGFNFPNEVSADAKEYVLDYSGPFYLSRGAPAWETLEEYPELEEPVAHALAKLHLMTGKGSPVPFDTAAKVLIEIEQTIDREYKSWQPKSDSKEGLALAKSIKKWRAEGDEERTRLLRRERFIRSPHGREIYRQALSAAVSLHGIPKSSLRSFCHGDSHGGNFILVRYRYVLNRPSTMLDRVFLNEIFEMDSSLKDVSIHFNSVDSRITYEANHGPSQEQLIATPKTHHEIHLIDLDGGQGTREETKVLHLHDALVYAMSLANLTGLNNSPFESSKILEHYYEGLEQRY